MQTPNDFEQWQQELLEKGELAMTKEEFEIAMDMMALEEDLTYDVEFELDGLGVTDRGDVVFTNKSDILYQKALQNQKRNKAIDKKRRETFKLILGG